MSSNYRAAVVGGGVTGLCAAFYLARTFGRDRVVLLEGSDEVGGQTRTSRSQGFVNDWGPNGFLDREPLTLQWVNDLGLSDQLVQARKEAARRFILRGARLREIPLSPPGFLLSDVLSVRGRLRVLFEPLVKSRGTEAESLWEFGARRIGQEAADFLIDPMASGIFGGDSRKLALAACFPRMTEMEHEHGSLFAAMRAKRKQGRRASAAGPAGTLTSFAGGIGVLPEKAASRDDFETRTGAAVSSVTRASDGYSLRLASGEEVRTDAVVVALPAYAASDVLRDLDAALAATLQEIPYAGMTVICGGYRREKVGHPLDGFGFLVPRREGLRLLGRIWTSSVFDHRAPEGWVQLRTMVGGATDPEAVNLSDKELLATFRREAGRLLSIDSDPEFLEVYRWKRAIPQFVPGHVDRVRRLEQAESRHPGLALAGNAYRGVGLNDCVVSAHRAVERISATAPR